MIFETEVLPIFANASAGVFVKIFESEPIHTKIPDFLIVEIPDMFQYKLQIELLRDTRVYRVPHFEIVALS